jgi:hypothetical protein
MVIVTLTSIIFTWEIYILILVEGFLYVDLTPFVFEHVLHLSELWTICLFMCNHTIDVARVFQWFRPSLLV